jgi:hypothetical protein
MLHIPLNLVYETNSEDLARMDGHGRLAMSAVRPAVV